MKNTPDYVLDKENKKNHIYEKLSQKMKFSNTLDSLKENEGKEFTDEEKNKILENINSNYKELLDKKNDITNKINSENLNIENLDTETGKQLYGCMKFLSRINSLRNPIWRHNTNADRDTNADNNNSVTKDYIRKGDLINERAYFELDSINNEYNQRKEGGFKGDDITSDETYARLKSWTDGLKNMNKKNQEGTAETES